MELTFVAMIRLLAYLTAVLIISGAAASQTRQVIVVEAAAAPGAPEFNSTLAEAVTNYLEYYLFRIGRSQETEIIGPRRASGAVDSLMGHSNTSALTHLTVSGRLKRGHSFYTDRRRLGHFVTRPNCLELRIEYDQYERSGAALENRSSGSVKEEARSRWLTFSSGAEARRLDSLVAVTAEPNEYVIRRAVERMFHSDLSDPAPEINTASRIPTVALVDSSYMSEIGEGWEQEAEALVAASSYFLARDFDISLDLQRTELGSYISQSARSAAERFMRFRKQFGPSGDTLFIGLYSRSEIEDFIGERETDAIGLSVTGERVMLLRQMPQAGRGDNLWRAQFNALVLVHELGHVLGAIHVSDPWSILCHNATWLAPSRFDSFNGKVMAAALSGEFEPGEDTDYLAFISRLLADSPYRLVDFPPVLYRCLRSTNLLVDPKVAFRTVGKSLLAAARGYGKLIEGNRAAAVELFAEAASEDTKQACLPYYLAQATSGSTSLAAMRRAAEMGYWQARLLLGRLSRPASDR